MFGSRASSFGGRGRGRRDGLCLAGRPPSVERRGSHQPVRGTQGRGALRLPARPGGAHTQR